MSIFPLMLRGSLYFIILCFGSPLMAQKSPVEIDRIILRTDSMSNLDSAVIIAHQTYKNAVKLDYQQGVLRSLSLLARKTLELGRFNEGLILADKTLALAKKMENFSVLSHLTTMKGQAYTRIGFLVESRKMLMEAKLYALKVSDPNEMYYRLGNIYTSLGLNYDNSSKVKDSVLFFNRQAYAAYRKIEKNNRYSGGLGMAANNLGVLYSYFKKFDSAAYYINKAIEIGTEDKNKTVLAYSYFSMGYSLLQKKEYSRAITFFNRSLPIASILHNGYLKRNIYEALAETYEKTKNPAKANLFLNKYKIISDSLTVNERESIKSPVGALINEKEQQQKERKKVFILVLAVVVSLMIVAVYGYVIFLKKFKRSETGKTELECLLKEKMGLLSEQSNLQRSDTEELKSVVQLAMSNDPSFFVKFKEFDSIFIKKVLGLSPKLVATELELCALLRLNFETKEIARYTRQSVRAVESKKYRIRKKLNVRSNVDLNIWMSTI